MNETSGPPNTPEFPDVPAFVSVLNRHGVSYVVIGGYVAQGFIADYVTHDVDFTPATDRENLNRLSLALKPLEATGRQFPLRVPDCPGFSLRRGAIPTPVTLQMDEGHCFLSPLRHVGLNWEKLVGGQVHGVGRQNEVG